MELYHGSEHIVELPRFGAGKPHNDYGLGFYCTEHEDMAKELDAAGITGTTLVCCGTWEDRGFLEKVLGGRPFVLGYPVAGGNIEFGNGGSTESPEANAISEGALSCCVFDHFMLNARGNLRG